MLTLPRIELLCYFRMPVVFDIRTCLRFLPFACQLSKIIIAFDYNIKLLVENYCKFFYYIYTIKSALIIAAICYQSLETWYQNIFHFTAHADRLPSKLTFRMTSHSCIQDSEVKHLKFRRWNFAKRGRNKRIITNAHTLLSLSL